MAFCCKCDRSRSLHPHSTTLREQSREIMLRNISQCDGQRKKRPPLLKWQTWVRKHFVWCRVKHFTKIFQVFWDSTSGSLNDQGKTDELYLQFDKLWWESQFVFRYSIPEGLQPDRFMTMPWSWEKIKAASSKKWINFCIQSKTRAKNIQKAFSTKKQSVGVIQCTVVRSASWK